MPPKQAVKQTQPPAVARGVQPGLTTTNRGFGDRRDAERQEPEYRQAIRPNDTIPKWRFYPGLMIHAVHHKEDVTQGPDGIDGNGWARNTNLQNGLGCYSKRRPFIVIHVFMETVALLPVYTFSSRGAGNRGLPHQYISLQDARLDYPNFVNPYPHEPLKTGWMHRNTQHVDPMATIRLSEPVTISYRAWATEIGQLTEESYNRMMNIFCSFWCRCDTPFIPAYFVREVYDNIYKSVYPDDSDRQGQHDPRRHRNVYERREGEDGRLPPARRIERTINRDPEDRNWRERVRERVAQQAAEGDTNTGPALYGPGGYQRETQERARQGTDGGATETVARQPAPPTEPTPVRQPVPPGPNAGRGIRRDEPTPAPRPRPQRTQQGPESAASRNPFDALTTDEGEEEEDEDGEEETEHARQTGPPRGPAPSQGLPGGDPNFDLPGTASDPTSNDPFTEPHRSSLSDTGDSGPPLPETHEVLDYDAVGGADTRNFGKLAGRLGLDQIHWSKDPIHDIDPLAGRRSFLTHPPTATEKMAYSVPHVTIQKLIDYDSREYWRRGYNITEDLDEEQTVTVLNYIDNQREFNQMQLNLHHQRAKLFRPGLVKWTKDILKGNKLWPVTEEELSTATEYAGDVQDTPVLIGYMQSFSEDMYDVYDEYFEPSDSDDSDRSDGGTTRPPRQMLQSFMFEQGRRDPAAVTPSRYKTPPAPIPERSTVEDDGKSPSSVAVTDQTSAEPSPPRRSLEEELAMGTEGFDSQSSNENGAQSGAEAEEEK